MKKKLSSFFLFIGLIFSPIIGVAQDTTSLPIAEATQFSEMLRIGQHAFEIGYFELALSFFKKASALPNLSQNETCLIWKNIVDTELALGEITHATQSLQPPLKIIKKASRDLQQMIGLRSAFLSAYHGDFQKAAKTLATLRIKNLSHDDTLLYYITKLGIDVSSQKLDTLNKTLAEIKQRTSSEEQSIHISQLITQLLTKAYLQNKNEKIATCLQNFHLNHFDSPHRGAFVRAYAFVLAAKGETERAKSMIYDEIQLLKNSPTHEIYLYQLYAAIADGIYKEENLKTVSNILLSSAPFEVKVQILKALISQAKTSSQSLSGYQILTDLPSTSLSPEIQKYILLARAELAINARHIEYTQRATEILANQFPQSPELLAIYEALAYLSLDLPEKDYRSAAYYLIKARDKVTDNEEKENLNFRIGNAFFCAQSYEIAQSIYEELLRSPVTSLDKEKILLYLVQCDLLLDENTKARAHLQDSDIVLPDRWAAELLYVHYEIEHKAIEEMTLYLDQLLKKYNKDIDLMSLIKLYLLHAHLLKSQHYFQRASITAAKITSLFPKKNVSKEVQNILEQALYIQGISELHLRNFKEGLAVISKLQKSFPQSTLAHMSYFALADIYFQNGDLALANQVLEEFTKKDTSLAPYAIYKQAEYWETMGMKRYDESAYKNAIHLFSKVSNTSHELSFAARLEIGHILRMMGEFSDAQLVYENLLKDFPADPRYHFVELCLAKSLLAQMHARPSCLDRAQMILERLYNTHIHDFSLKIEMDATYILTLKINHSDHFDAVAWDVLLAAANHQKSLTQNDIYWLIQIIHLIEDHPDTQNNITKQDALHDLLQKLQLVNTE